MVFTFAPHEYVDMLLIYGECRRNSRAAALLYRERFPERHPPSHVTFIKAERKLRTGVFPDPKHPQRRAAVRNEETMINVLAYVAINPQVSIRKLSEELEISKSTIQRILKEHTYHPFKVHLVQGLTPADFNFRLEFIARMQVFLHDNPDILNKICWTDESRFHNNGVVNRHNSHYWSNENPHWAKETRFQNMWGINVWCGIFNGQIIGPHLYEGTLTGQTYLHFLQTALPALLENIPLAERRNMIWQQDGAPPHNHRIVTEHLNAVFPNGWVGNRGPIHWPARSPDLTPLDFFLWGYVKDTVYLTQPVNLEDLKNRIREACARITPAMLRAACTRELQRRWEACVEAGGAQFEQFLS